MSASGCRKSRSFGEGRIAAARRRAVRSAALTRATAQQVPIPICTKRICVFPCAIGCDRLAGGTNIGFAMPTFNEPESDEVVRPIGRPADRVIYWPSVLALVFTAWMAVNWANVDLLNHKAQDFRNFGYALYAIIAAIAVFVPLWFGAGFVFVFLRQWRKYVSCCVVPAVVLAGLWPLWYACDPLRLLVASGALAAEAAKSGLPAGHRFAAFDITQGLFVPPLRLLIYDETDQIGERRDRFSGPVALRGSVVDKSIMQGCAGISDHISGHYYVCNAERSQATSIMMPATGNYDVQ